MSNDNDNSYEKDFKDLEQDFKDLDEDLNDLDSDLEEDLDADLEEDLNNIDLNNIDLDDLEDIDTTENVEDLEKVSEDVFSEFFGNEGSDASEESLDIFDNGNAVKLEDMMDDVEPDNKDKDSELWHDFTDDKDLFKDPEKELQDAVDFTEKDFNNITSQVIIIDGMTEKFEVEALKALTMKQANIDRGSTCFISASGTLIEVGKLEVCLDTFIDLMDMWNYDIYILTSTEDGMIQNKVDLSILGLLLV